jgi:hypothetical protein
LKRAEHSSLLYTSRRVSMADVGFSNPDADGLKLQEILTRSPQSIVRCCHTTDHAS